MKTVWVNTPLRDEHCRWLEEAAEGRCRLVYSAETCPEAEALIGALPVEALGALPQLQWFHLVWAGVDKYPAAEMPAGVAFTNGSGAYGAYIAEHMLACILSLYRQLPHYAALQRQHIWDNCWQEGTLEGKTVLILGTGDLGSSLARRLRAFDCRVVGQCRRPRPLPHFDQVVGIEALDQLLPQADVVACVLPGTRETAGLLDRRRLFSLKPGAILVNCGRGTVLDTAALAEAIPAVPLLGCALDVTDPEPLPPESPLWDMEQVILTPHISGISFGHLPACEDRIYRLAAENLRRWLDGAPLLNQVDLAAGYRLRETGA